VITSPENPTGAGVGVSPELAAILSKPASRRIAERGELRSSRDIAEGAGGEPPRQSVDWSKVAEERASALDVAEAAVKALRMELDDKYEDDDEEEDDEDDEYDDDEEEVEKVVQFDGSEEEDDEGDEQSDHGSDDEGEGESDDSAGDDEDEEGDEGEERVGGAPPMQTAAATMKPRYEAKSLRTKAAKGTGKLATKTAAKTAVGARASSGVSRLAGSRSERGGVKAAGAGDKRIVAAVARSKPSRLRRLLDQEVACQQAVAAALSGA